MGNMAVRTTKLKLALMACIMCSTVANAADVSSKPLARLANGEVITEQDLSAYLDQRIDLRGAVRSAWGVEHVVKGMALTRVLNLEGERLGMPRSTSDQPQRFDDVYGFAVQRKQEPECKRPESEAEARAYFDAHPQAFVVPAQARVQRVIVPAASPIDGQPAIEWLTAQTQAIVAGKSRFADLAQRAETIYTLEPQGDLGWINLEGDNNIVQAIRGAGPGDILGPLQEGTFGYLFQVVSKRPSRALTWEEAKPFAAARAEAHCHTEGQEKLRSSLFKQYGVEIDSAAIREFMESTINRRR